MNMSPSLRDVHRTGEAIAEYCFFSPASRSVGTSTPLNEGDTQNPKTYIPNQKNAPHNQNDTQKKINW